MFEARCAYSAVKEVAIGSDKEALHNPERCESGMNANGLLLCCSSSVSFQRLVVTEEKKWGQNNVKSILSYSLMAWHKRRREEGGRERRGGMKVIGVFHCAVYKHHYSVKVSNRIFYKTTQTGLQKMAWIPVLKRQSLWKPAKSKLA